MRRNRDAISGHFKRKSNERFFKGKAGVHEKQTKKWCEFCRKTKKVVIATLSCPDCGELFPQGI